LFWKCIQDEFDSSEARAVVEPQIESFDRPVTRGFQVQLVPSEQLPRCFYRHRNRSELVQVQSDRFGFNWLKHDGGTYPHSEATVARFFGLYEKFLAFCEERGFGEPTVRQCEITNVNIVSDTAVGGVVRASEYFTQIPAATGPAFLQTETLGYSLQQLILDDAGKPAGRLYQVFSPALRTDTMEQAYRLEFTARGAPLGAGKDGVETFFSLARSAINGAFLAATTQRAQSQWGYSDGDRI
jgi:hypothetical protein